MTDLISGLFGSVPENVPCCNYLWRIPWISDPVRRIPYMYHTDGSKFGDGKVGYNFFLCTTDEIVEKSQLRLTERLIVFAVEVLTIKEAISEALQKSLVYLDIFSDFRSALQVFCRLVSLWSVVGEFKNMIKGIGIRVASGLIKAAAAHPSANAQIFSLASRQDKRPLWPGSCNLEAWVGSWATYVFFQRVSTCRTQGISILTRF